MLRSVSGPTALGLLLALVVGLVGSAAAFAQTATPSAMACGRVVAYTPPTATTPGSIILGTTTFALKAGSLPDNPNAAGGGIAIGAIVCLEENKAGEILARTHLIDLKTICGMLAALTEATATAEGSITLQGNRARIIQVRVNTSLSGAHTGGQFCFKFDFDAAGDPEIVAFVGPPPTPAGPKQLPSTSTEAPPRAAVGLLVIGLLVVLAMVRIRPVQPPS